MAYILDFRVMKQFKTWDDPSLIKQTDFREIFEGWKANRVSTPAVEEKRLRALIDTFHFSKIQVCYPTVSPFIVP